MANKCAATYWHMSVPNLLAHECAATIVARRAADIHNVLAHQAWHNARILNDIKAFASATVIKKGVKITMKSTLNFVVDVN